MFDAIWRPLVLYILDYLVLVGLLVVLCENLASSLFKGAPGRLRIPIKASWAKLSFDLRPNIGIRSHNEKILG